MSTKNQSVLRRAIASSQSIPIIISPALKRRVNCTRLALALVATLVPLTTWAAKPVKPPPTPNAEPGVIFYTLDGQVMVANSDGSNQYALFTPKQDAPDVSALRHSSSYWFLDVREVLNEPTYPSPYGRTEIYAVNESGLAVRLTSDPTLDPRPAMADGYCMARWLAGDTHVAFQAQRWDLDTMTVIPDSTGIYVMEVDFSAGMPQVVTPPVQLDWTSSLFDGSSVKLVGFDFSPDANTIYFAERYDFYSADTISGVRSGPLAAAFGYPRLCATTRTLVGFGGAYSSITTVHTDGSGLTTIVPASNKGWGAVPIWSPNGTCIVYSSITIINEWQRQRQLVIATASGQKISTLGAKVNGVAFPLGWRPLP